MQYLLIINDSLQDHEREMVNAYWAIEKGEFVHKVAELAVRFGVTVPYLSGLAKSNSDCKISFGNCLGCGDEMLTSVNTKAAFQACMAAFDWQRCAECQRAFDKRQRFERNLAAGQPGSVLGNNAVELKAWELLTPQEADILKAIVQLKVKAIIYAYIFKDGNLADKAVWGPINRLVKKGLLVINYEFDSGRVVESFSYPPILESVFSHNELCNAPQTSPADYFHVKLFKSQDQSASYKVTYAGVFTMQADVALQRGVRYCYGGWVRKQDGTITLQIAPFEQLLADQIPSGTVIEAQLIKTMLRRFASANEDNISE